MAATNEYIGAIEGFKNTIQSIQRTSLFDVSIANFAYGNAPGKILKFSVKGAPFPAATVGDIVVNYMGRQIHWYGDRNYGGTWATTIILDGGWQTYEAIYLWNQAMNGSNRIVSQEVNAHLNFKKDAYVTAYTTDGRPAHSVMLKGLWPQDIAELGMDWGTVDTAAELTVTWVYDYVVTVSSGIGAQTSSKGSNSSTQLTVATAEGRSAKGTIGGSRYGGSGNSVI